MSSEMTNVYSGGLVYEYTYEANEFGVVQINGKAAKELDGFAKYQSALSKYPAPTGDGGFTSTTAAVACPTKDTNWLVDSTLLPEMPEKAKDYFKNGAGTGPGLNGDGSQDSGSDDIPDATPGSGTATGTPTASASASDNAAGPSFSGPMDKAPFIVTGIAVFFSLAGTLLL
jgi:hypothetical protein